MYALINAVRQYFFFSVLGWIMKREGWHYDFRANQMYWENPGMGMRHNLDCERLVFRTYNHRTVRNGEWESTDVDWHCYA